jgi:hypothetical protein
MGVWEYGSMGGEKPSPTPPHSHTDSSSPLFLKEYVTNKIDD